MAAAVALIAFILCSKLPKSKAFPDPVNNRSCVDLVLPVPITAHNAIYSDSKRVDNNIDSTQFTVDLDTWTTIKGIPAITQNITISSTFNISAKLCIPPTGAKKSHLQIATHGLGFDKRYWDPTINPSEYSYVDAALAAGYRILTYDRLGTGLSDKPDAYNVVQAPLQLEILRGIISQARSGELLQCARLSNSSTAPASFDKIITVGHSFGSFLTTALLATYPNLTDAAVLTGYIPNNQLANMAITSGGLLYAAENDPTLFSDRGSGYIVPGTRSSLQAGFFSMRANTTSGLGGFEPELLDYAFSIRQPTTVGEWVSGGTLNLGPAPGFRGPVQFVVGEFDFAVCKGDCRGTYSEEALKIIYPHVSDLKVYLQDGTGHGLTLHRGANVGYKVTLDWLEGNGL